MATKFNLNIDQGSRYSKVVQVNDDAGDPRILTGYSAELHIKRTIDSPTTLLELSSPASGLTINAIAGQITITISTAQTTAMTWATGVYDLRITDGTSESERILEGDVSVSPQVTT